MELIETHAHLDNEAFIDVDNILLSAEKVGVKHIITIGTNIESTEKNLQLVDKFSTLFLACGLHPTEVDKNFSVSIDWIKKLGKQKKMVAIGEIGLDYYRIPSNLEKEVEIEDWKENQKTAFIQQLDLAVEWGLNVIIHQRSAWEDTVSILEKYRSKLKAVFHCFSGTLEQAMQLEQMEILMSFTGMVTFKNSVTVQEVVQKISDHSFMLETDCPYMAPDPFRGNRSEPAHVRVIAEKIASLRKVSVEKIAQFTTENAQKFFSFSG